MKAFKNAALFACAIGIFIAPPAWADKGGKSHGKGNGQSHYSSSNEGDRSDYQINIQIGGSDREKIRQYVREDAFRHCPPGLAKKNPPCVPPGQAKKWQMGRPLEADYVLVPGDWGLHPPRGYQYVQVDKDILLIGEASKKVIDAVTLLSAVGN